MEIKRSVGSELRTLTNLIKREVIRHTENCPGHSATYAHGRVVGYLIENRDKDLFQRDIEQAFNIRRSTATKMLQLMEKNGFITRQPVGYDARLKKILLTEKAVRHHEDMHKSMEEMEERLLRNISDEEIETFFSIIQKIKRNLE